MHPTDKARFNVWYDHCGYSSVAKRGILSEAFEAGLTPYAALTIIHNQVDSFAQFHTVFEALSYLEIAAGCTFDSVEDLQAWQARMNLQFAYDPPLKLYLFHRPAEETQA